VINQQKKNEVVQSATFDFAFRYSARDACNGNAWNKLANGGLATESGYSRYAVTFVENHDMQDRGNVTGYEKDPITNNIEAANAWLMAMPGTPCVFLLHWKRYKNEIKQMILARKVAGISNQSSWEQKASSTMFYKLETTGSNGKLYAILGSGSLEDDNYVKILSGTKYAYYLSKSTETPWVSLAEGTYSSAMDATLTAVSENADAQLVYTIDGTDPTSISTKVSSGTAISISETCTLKIGLLVDGKVKSIITRKYVIKPFVAHKAVVYLKDPNWSTDVYFYSWANDGKNTQLLGNWPGTAISDTKEIDGVKWYYHEFDVNTENYSFNIIFNQGNGKTQTVDIGPLSEDTYYEIGDVVNGKFTVNNITETVTGIIPVKNLVGSDSVVKVYTLDGRLVKTSPNNADALSGLAKGIYIVNKKKFIVR
jgi:alpha-amylase